MNPTISQAEYQTACNYLVQYLRDSGFRGDLDDGTAVYDLLIKPYALLYVLFTSMADRSEAFLSLDRADALKETLGDDYDMVVDSILSNWFVSRKDGSPTTGILRLYFSKPLEFYDIPEGEVLSEFDGVRYAAADRVTASTESFKSVQNTVNNRTEYYFDVQVRSTENTDKLMPVDAEPDTFIQSIYFLRAAPVEEFTPGEAKESTPAFRARTEEAINTRELITSRAINTVIPNAFDEVASVHVVRFGAPEMRRDLVEYNGFTVHVGNKADLYIDPKAFLVTRHIPVEEDGGVRLDSLTFVPVAVVSVTGSDGTDYPLSFTGLNSGQWGSTRVSGSVVPAGAVPGETVSVTYMASSLVGRVQDFVTSRDRRVVCYDPLVKSRHCVLIRPELRFIPESGVDGATVGANIAAAAQRYIADNATPDLFSASRMLRSIHDSVPDVRAIRLGSTIPYSFVDPDSGAIRTGTLDDVFTLPTDTVNSAQVSQETSILVSARELITTVQE